MKFLEYLQLINESKQPQKIQMINEGGAAGHMPHIFENYDMTFAELKNMLSEVFNGKLKLSEKTDGANISVSWKDGELLFARSATSVANPLKIEDLDNWVSESENKVVRGSMAKAVRSLDEAFHKMSSAKLNKWFKNGKNFMSCEVICPDTTNVIDYGDVWLIQIHNITEYEIIKNSRGNLTSVKKKENPAIAYDIIKTLEKVDALNHDVFTITGPQVVSINDAFKAEKELKNIDKELSRFMSRNKLSDSDTIGSFVKSEFAKYISKKPLGKLLKGHQNMFDIVFNKIVVGDNSIKKTRLPIIATEEGIDASEFITAYNELINEGTTVIKGELLYPLEIICFKAAAAFLQLLSGFLAANPTKMADNIRTELEDTIEEFKNNPEVGPLLLREIKKVEDIGINKLVPTEGVVFVYNDKVYKLTGVFAPANKILNRKYSGNLK